MRLVQRRFRQGFAYDAGDRQDFTVRGELKLFSPAKLDVVRAGHVSPVGMRPVTAQLPRMLGAFSTKDIDADRAV